jgi:hypothetical protein
MQAFKTFLLNSDMMAYLAMMAPRLVELRRVPQCWLPSDLGWPSQGTT